MFYLVCYSRSIECNGTESGRTTIPHAAYNDASAAQAGENCCATGGGSWYQVGDYSQTCNPCHQGT